MSAKVDVLANESNRISGGATAGTPMCPSCPHLRRDHKFNGWGWCGHSDNRVYSNAWPDGFTPSQSPTGSCDLHPERASLANIGQHP